MPRLFLTALAGLALLAPATAFAQTDAATYLKKAGAGDLYERQSSQAALQQASDPRVKRFAEQMIADHRKSTADLKAAAAAAGVQVPAAALEPAQRAMVDALKPLSGAAFDKLYLDQQKQAHTAALALHRGYAEKGDKPALRETAGKIAPVVARHLEMLNNDLAHAEKVGR